MKVLQIHDLLAMGGKFYPMGKKSYCDTPLDTWVLRPDLGGFINVEDESPEQPDYQDHTKRFGTKPGQ